MFYLVEFFKVVKTNTMAFVLLSASSFGIIFLSSNFSLVKEKLSLSSQAQETPYFNALISKKMQVDGVLRRMKKLPGVIAADKPSNTQIKTEIEKIKKVFGGDIIRSLASVDYTKIRISLEAGIKKKSYELIKEYLQRLVGATSVTMGEIKYPNQGQVKLKGFLGKFLSWINIYTLSVLGGIWLVSLVLFARPLISHAYIIEKFQRKNLVGLKIGLLGMSTLLAILMGGTYFFNSQIEVYGIAASLMMMVFVGLILNILPKKFIYT